MKYVIGTFCLFLLLCSLTNATQLLNNSDENLQVNIKVKKVDLPPNASFSLGSLVRKSTFSVNIANDPDAVKCELFDGSRDPYWYLEITNEHKCKINIKPSDAPYDQDQLESVSPLGKGLSASHGVELYRLKGTTKVVAVKIMPVKDEWGLIKNEISGILSMKKNPFAVKPISVLYANIREKISHFVNEKKYVWLIMEPYLGGTLGDAIGALTNSTWEEPHFAEHSVLKPLETEDIKFYVANLGLILDATHKLNVAWSDVKPLNVLIDEKGYLKAVDFGRVVKLSDELRAKDWEQVGKRIMIEGFGIRSIAKPDEEQEQILDLSFKLGREIQSLAELKEHVLFRNFPWEKMLKKELSAPYTPERKEIKGCHECVEYRVEQPQQRIYMSPEIKDKWLGDIIGL